MASSGSGRRRIGSSSSNNNEGGVLARITSTINESAVVQKGKQLVSDATDVGTKLLRSTGKAAWITGTTLLILGVPLLIEIERDQQLSEFELQQASLLGTPAVAPK